MLIASIVCQCRVTHAYMDGVPNVLVDTVLTNVLN